MTKYLYKYPKIVIVKSQYCYVAMTLMCAYQQGLRDASGKIMQPRFSQATVWLVDERPLPTHNFVIGPSRATTNIAWCV